MDFSKNVPNKEQSWSKKRKVNKKSVPKSHVHYLNTASEEDGEDIAQWVNAVTEG